MDSALDRHYRLTISFDQLKESWAAFDLDLVETELTNKLILEPIDPTSTKFTDIHTIDSNLYWQKTLRYPPFKDKPRVHFHCFSESGHHLTEHPITWFAVGPKIIRGQENFRFIEELEHATTEQRQQVAIDGFMTSLDAKYFWCGRLIIWIEENCQDFHGDIEDLAVEFTHFFAKEDADDWTGDNCRHLIFVAIQLFFDAIKLTLSDSEIERMESLLSAHFESHTMANRKSIENYMAATQWANIKHRLNAEYGESANNVYREKKPSPDRALHANQFESSERYTAILEEHAIRNAKRALRRIKQLEDLDRNISQVILYHSIDTAVDDLSTAISYMSEKNSIHYKKVINSLTKTEGSAWGYQLVESVRRYNLQLR